MSDWAEEAWWDSMLDEEDDPHEHGLLERPVFTSCDRCGDGIHGIEYYTYWGGVESIAGFTVRDYEPHTKHFREGEDTMCSSCLSEAEARAALDTPTRPTLEEEARE